MSAFGECRGVSLREEVTPDVRFRRVYLYNSAKADIESLGHSLKPDIGWLLTLSESGHLGVLPLQDLETFVHFAFDGGPDQGGSGDVVVFCQDVETPGKRNGDGGRGGDGTLGRHKTRYPEGVDEGGITFARTSVLAPWGEGEGWGRHNGGLPRYPKEYVQVKRLCTGCADGARWRKRGRCRAVTRKNVFTCIKLTEMY